MSARRDRRVWAHGFSSPIRLGVDRRGPGPSPGTVWARSPVNPRARGLPADTLLERLAPLRPVAGSDRLMAHQAIDVFALWEAWETEAGRVLPPPYWAVVWPASRALIEAMAAGCVALAGRRVLEIGCGGAAAAIAAARAGAAGVEANDIDPAALHVAGRNAAANGVELRVSSIDYAGGDSGEPDAEVVLIADLFYERSCSERLAALLARLRARGAQVLVADGGRPFAPRAGIELVWQSSVEVDGDLEGVTARTVRVLRLA